MLVIHTSHESGRDNADGVRPDYLVCDYLGSYPDGGFPYGHQAKNTVHSASIFPLGISKALRPLRLPSDICPFCDSNKANRHYKDFDRRAANALLGTKFVPLPEDGKKAVMSMCDFSACGRAVYDYVNDCWQPMPQLENLSGFDRDTRSFSHQPPVPPQPEPLDVRADLERLLSVETPEPAREVTRFGLSAEQIGEVQQRLSGLQPGAISSVKRIRENSRLLREQSITQANLAELFDYLAVTGAIEWLAIDQRNFRYIGGL